MTVKNPEMSNVLPLQLQRLAPYYVLVVLVGIFYSNIYDNFLLYDDIYLIQKNSYLQNWGNIGTIFTHYVNGGAMRLGHFYRPLQNVLYLIIYQIGGVTLFGFHLLNVGLHAGNACLVYTLGRRINIKAWPAFFAALIWALHPLQTEAVTYMSATADTLYVFFCLFGLIALLPDFSPRKFYSAGAFFILGLLSKETAIVFPALAMACLFYLSKDRRDPRIYLCTWPLWLIALLYVVLRLLFMPFGGVGLLNVDPNSQMYGTDITLRINTVLATLPSYLGLLVWPVGLHMDRDFPIYLNPFYWEVGAGALILIAAIAQISWGKAQRGLALSWGLIWFAICHSPQTGLIIPVNSLFLEHWMYMPTIGLTLGLTQSIMNFLENKPVAKLAGVAAASLALILGWQTYEQNKIWHDAFVFYPNIFKYGEKSARAHNNLGIAYMNANKDDLAMEQFRATMTDYDLMPETHKNIAALLSKNSDGKTHIPEEIAELKRAIEINPDFISAYDALADVYRFTGDKDQADYYQTRADQLRKKHRFQ